jgi:hypothetical protein
VEIRLMAREADPSEIVEDRDGAERRRGTPLRNFLDRMNANDGWVDVHITTLAKIDPATAKVAGSLKTVTTSSPVVKLDTVSADVPMRVVDDATVQINLNRWRDRDPDSTYLVVGWHIVDANPAK